MEFLCHCCGVCFLALLQIYHPFADCKKKKNKSSHYEKRHVLNTKQGVMPKQVPQLQKLQNDLCFMDQESSYYVLRVDSKSAGDEGKSVDFPMMPRHYNQHLCQWLHYKSSDYCPSVGSIFMQSHWMVALTPECC